MEKEGRIPEEGGGVGRWKRDDRARA